MQSRFVVLAPLVVLACLVGCAAGAVAEEPEEIVDIATLKMKSGKVLTLVKQGWRGAVFLKECHAGRVKVTSGIMYHYESGTVCDVFDKIEIDYDDYRKVIELGKEAVVIRFGKPENGTLGMTVVLTDGSSLELSVVWPELDDLDVVEGIERTLGEISIPISQVVSVTLLDPSGLATRGKPKKARPLASLH